MRQWILFGLFRASCFWIFGSRAKLARTVALFFFDSATKSPRTVALFFDAEGWLPASCWRRLSCCAYKCFYLLLTDSGGQRLSRFVGRATVIRVGLAFAEVCFHDIRVAISHDATAGLSWLIVCKGRAVVRVRVRRGVVRVHNRNTEIGAVVRVARTGGDMT